MDSIEWLLRWLKRCSFGWLLGWLKRGSFVWLLWWLKGTVLSCYCGGERDEVLGGNYGR